MISHKIYHDYLQKRSVFGKIYRRFFLYPRISKLLSGLTLDIGCGIGDMLRYRKDTVGVDINPYNVEFCIKQDFSARIMEPDILPFEDSKFDTVLLDNVLEHIVEPSALLAEIKRVLRPSGLLVIGVPGQKGFAADPDHRFFYDKRVLESLALVSGFRVNKYKYAPLFRSSFLSRTLTQYCIYTQWQKIN